MELVSDQGDELRIRRFTFCIAHRITEKSLQSIQVASVPSHFDGMTDSPLHSAWRGVEGLGHLRVEYLGDGIGVLTARLGVLPDAAGEPCRDKYFEREFIALFVPIDNYCLLAYTNDTKSQDSGQARNL